MNKIVTIIALSCLPALPAVSATITAVGTGVIQSGYDETDLFGLGTDLTGYTATLTFVYDTEALPNRSTYSDSTYVSDDSTGAPVFSRASLRIGDYEYAMPVTYFGVAQLVRGEGYESYNLFSQYYSIDYEYGYEYGATWTDETISLGLGELPAGVTSLNDAFSWSGVSYYGSSFRVATYDGISGYLRNISGYLTIDSLIVSSEASLPAVPLPAGAPLILSGLVALFALAPDKAQGHLNASFPATSAGAGSRGPARLDPSAR